MFRTDELALVDFYTLCRNEALGAGYSLLVCLLAREADSPEIFEEVGSYWSSFHDLTSSSILFLFAGEGAHNRVRSDLPVHRQSRQVVAQAYSGAAALAGAQEIELPDWTRQQLRRDLRVGMPRLLGNDTLAREHTLQITELSRALEVPEESIPALHVTFLGVGMQAAIPLERGVSVYRLIKKLIEAIQPHVDRSRELKRDQKAIWERRLSLEKKLRDHPHRTLARIEAWFDRVGADSRPPELSTLRTKLTSLSRQDARTQHGKSAYFDAFRELRALLPDEFRDVGSDLQRFFDRSRSWHEASESEGIELGDIHDVEKRLRALEIEYQALESRSRSAETAIRRVLWRLESDLPQREPALEATVRDRPAPVSTERALADFARNLEELSGNKDLLLDKRAKRHLREQAEALLDLAQQRNAPRSAVANRLGMLRRILEGGAGGALGVGIVHTIDALLRLLT